MENSSGHSRVVANFFMKHFAEVSKYSYYNIARFSN